MLAYFRERLPLRIYLPLAGGLALAAHPVRHDATSFVIDTTLAFLLVATTRLWDDLADREHDALLHPARALVRADSTAGYTAACVCLALATVALVLSRPGANVAGPILLALYSTLAALYTRRTRRSVVTETIVLSKYAAFVLVIAADAIRVATLITALMVSAAACAYEAWHDPRSGLGQKMRRVQWQ
jgi:4-hydroxybenzoate polyprenyltransferase